MSNCGWPCINGPEWPSKATQSAVVTDTGSDSRPGRCRLCCRCPTSAGGQPLLFGERDGVNEGLQGRLAEAPAPLVRPSLVVVRDPGVEVGLQLLDAAVDALAEGDLVELVQHGAVEALADPIRLRALGDRKSVV